MKKKGRALGRRSTQVTISQLVSGHTRLNAYQNWKNPEVSPYCPNCDALETTNHCPRYENERHHMLMEADNIHETYNTAKEDRDTDIVTLAGMRNERHHMLMEADNIHETYNTAKEDRDTDIVTLAGMRNERHHMLMEADNIHETYNTAKEDRDTDIVTLAGMRVGLPEGANNHRTTRCT
ncbi:hypothetical protein Bbelb_410360 [Branchiostoma belcheri]|nr:hypothetical protein Bbelb_410360 [Branchiostoma belcheri]